MKNIIVPLTTLLLMVSGSALQAQTLNWGSEVFSNFADSNGNSIDQDTFIFELGGFVNGFAPDSSNVDLWSANWQVFDRAGYNEGNGYFNSSVNLLNDGTSNSVFESPLAASFVGLEAYIWVRNSDSPVEGTEWLLTRASSWVFPIPDPTEDCCDTGVIEWSVSDLKSEIPKWGNQGGIPGPGVFTTTGPYTLQTFTFVPEPSSSLMLVFAGSLALMRRRRNC